LLAVERGHSDIVEILLSSGADVSLTDARHGRSVLHLAALYGHLPVVRHLLSYGASGETKDNHGRTPYYYSAKHGHRAVSETLLAHGSVRETDFEENFGTSPHLSRTMNEGEAAAWYLNHRGWAVKTRDHLLVFDAEEYQVTRPTEPSLANGFLTPAEIGRVDVTAFYTCYHGAIGEPAYIHEIEDSLVSVTYVQNAGDGWRGSERSVYLSPKQDTTVGNVSVSTISVTQEMPSLGYVVRVDGLVIFYAGFGAEDHDLYRQGLQRLAESVDRIDMAFLPLVDSEEDEADYRSFLDLLNPRSILVLDPNRREHLYPTMGEKARGWGYDPVLCAAENPGDVFLYSGSR
jgi:hypothetical protein